MKSWKTTNAIILLSPDELFSTSFYHVPNKLRVLFFNPNCKYYVGRAMSVSMTNYDGIISFIFCWDRKKEDAASEKWERWTVDCFPHESSSSLREKGRIYGNAISKRRKRYALENIQHRNKLETSFFLIYNALHRASRVSSLFCGLCCLGLNFCYTKICIRLKKTVIGFLFIIVSPLKLFFECSLIWFLPSCV